LRVGTNGKFPVFTILHQRKGDDTEEEGEGKGFAEWVELKNSGLFVLMMAYFQENERNKLTFPPF